MRKTSTKLAFTIVELLVVIGIIALVISVLLPALSAARQAAVRVTCLSNVRQIGVMTLMYAAENTGRVPGVEYTSNSVAGQYSHLVRQTSRFPENFRGVALMMLKGFKMPLRSLFCPGRSTSDPLSYEANYFAQYINNSLGAGDTWNPGFWNGASSNNWGNIGYMVADSDRSTNRVFDFSKWHRVGRCNPMTPLVMDMFGTTTLGGGTVSSPSTGWTMSRHGKGYNVAFFDGSAAFVPDPGNILDLHCNAKYWDSDNTRPIFNSVGVSIVTSNGSPTDLSGHQCEYRRGVGDTVKYAGDYSNGVAWIEHWFLGWSDAQIKKNYP